MKSGNRRGEILYWGAFSARGKLYTDFENRGKIYAGALFPPMGEILSRARFSGGKDYAGGAQAQVMSRKYVFNLG